jgi:hypothetical protein
MIKEVIKMPPVFYGIDDTPLSVHLLEIVYDGFIKLNFLEQPVQKPAHE